MGLTYADCYPWMALGIPALQEICNNQGFLELNYHKTSVVKSPRELGLFTISEQ